LTDFTLKRKGGLDAFQKRTFELEFSIKI